MKKKTKEEKQKSEEASNVQKSEEISEGVGTNVKSQSGKNIDNNDKA